MKPERSRLSNVFSLTWHTPAIKLEPGPLDALSPVVAPNLLGGVADGHVQLAVLAAVAGHAGAHVAVRHVDAGAVVHARVGLAFVVVRLAVVT